MPLYLPPLSRRRFLGSSLLAGAGLMFHRSLLAEEKPVDEHCWALFSDTHIAANAAEIHLDANMTEHFNRAGREVLEMPQRPAALLISGDCAFNDGSAADYAALGKLLLPLRSESMSIHITLGNHDERTHFWSALAAAKTVQPSVPDHQVALVETARANWFILDSLEKVLSTPGELGAAQLAWLAKSLDAHPAKPALIVTHHNLVYPGGYAHGLKDTDKLLAIIRPRPQVKACLYGHTHKWEIGRDASGIHLVNLPPVGFVFDKTQPAGWVKADLKTGGLRLELRCLDQKHKSHGQVVDLAWRA